MSKSILVLEENSVVHGLVASALDMDGLTLHHEFNPAKYVERARTLQPDLILFSNADQGNQYSILRQLKTQAGLGSIPLVLMANSRDRVDPAQLKQLKVAGLVRKPFEASDLQQQVSKHLDLIEMIGSAYEYQKSQSARDEGINPLAQIDVLDPEVLSLMQDSGKPGTPGPGGLTRRAAVPDVDFTAELRQDRPAGPRMAAARPPAAQPDTRDDLALLDDGPVETFSFGNAEPMPGEDVLLDEGDLVPPLHGSPRSGGTGAFEDTSLQELGPEDLLDDEAYEQTSTAPAGVDQVITRSQSVTSTTTTRLDEIELELSSDDLSFPEDMPKAPMPARPAAPRASAAAPKAPPAAMPPARPAAPEPGGDLPPAVRRMMELKPVFSKSPDAATLDADVLSAPADSLPGEPDLMLGDDELDEAAILRAMEQEDVNQLAPLDGADPDLLGLTSSEDIDIEGEMDLAPLPAMPEVDDMDLTIDEDEEELILSSLDEEHDPDAVVDTYTAPEPPIPASARMSTGSAAPSMASTPSPRSSVAVSSLTESSLDSGDLSASVELTREERAGLNEMLTMQQEEVLSEDTFSVSETRTSADRSAFNDGEAMAKADQDEMDLLDDLGSLDDAPPASGTSEAEMFVNETFQNTPRGLPPAGDNDLLLPTDELLEVPVPEPEGMSWESSLETHAEAHTDTVTMDSSHVLSAQMADETDDSGDGSDSFEDAFAALKEDIEANPQGERIDDILKMEQLQDEVAKIEFTVPQHEHALARGIPLYSVPAPVASRLSGAAAAPHAVMASMGDGGEDSVEAMRRIVGDAPGGGRVQASSMQATRNVTTTTRETTTRMAQGAALSDNLSGDLSGSLLDEATKARLSQVLDEIISVSVRKAVREEMPRLMERMTRE